MAKYISAKEAVQLVKDNDYIVFGMAAAEPQDFVSHLHEVADKINLVTVSNCLPVTDAPFFADEKYKDKFQVDGWFFSPTMRKNYSNGNIAYIPNHLHYAGWKRFQFMKPKIYAGSASMPDKHGFISLSTCNVYEKQAIEKADITILEINPNFPRVFGDVEIHIDDVDYVIESNYMPPVIPDSEPNEKDLIIGKLIADMIPDGATLQLGIGGMPDAVAASLYDKKDLGLHTEMFTTGAMKLIKAGVITGKKKTLHPGKHVACFAYGSKELYEFLDNNPTTLMFDGKYVNDPYIIGLNHKQVSINAALEVDFTGQVASESIGTRHWSGSGGQTDTAVGAQNSKDGISFIALYSTAMVRNPETGIKEEKSKIVPTLLPGAGITLSRNDVDKVVTEYGVADLRGTSIPERCKLLIGIAHPKFREELTKEAIKLGYIKE